jgi:hypothetical protein
VLGGVGKPRGARAQLTTAMAGSEGDRSGPPTVERSTAEEESAGSTSREFAAT